MYPADFEYHAPATLDEAVALLSAHKDDAKLLAGGHSLLPMMKLRFAQPRHLVDVRRIPGLSEIRAEADAIAIGARVTHRMVERSELIARRLPMLSEAAAMIGDPAVRNRGTMGGSLAHADPAADLPAVMLALDADLRAVGPKGTRLIPAENFFLSLLTTALEPTEVLSEVRIPLPSVRSGGAYEKRRHPASRFAIVGVAALVELDAKGVVSAARVAVTGLGSKASRATKTEQALVGRKPDEAELDAAARQVADGIELHDDRQGPAAYRAHLATVYATRALRRAVERARAS
ncbi:MAG TPA: xanthine dehydrogenase family protein subunit M [Gemmatimonadaceae bacterium]|nr:xanthine dehydrogenase family protein subunit M [Gemmatimonadaceae bacterium]